MCVRYLCACVSPLALYRSLHQDARSIVTRPHSLMHALARRRSEANRCSSRPASAAAGSEWEIVRRQASSLWHHTPPPRTAARTALHRTALRRAAPRRTALHARICAHTRARTHARVRTRARSRARTFPRHSRRKPDDDHRTVGEGRSATWPRNPRARRSRTARRGALLSISERPDGEGRGPVSIRTHRKTRLAETFPTLPSDSI